MKKLITPILFLASILSANNLIAQTTHPFELGFNAGASWLKSDIKMKKLGGAAGFTFGQMRHQDKKHALDWGWRFQYLNAVAYGQDNEKSTGIKNNEVLNGKVDTSLNYFSNGGFVYQNYKTTLKECSLDLVVGLNKMRINTKYYPYVFGGLGITKAVAKTNQLDANNKRYDYSKIDSLGNASATAISTNLNNLYDGTYETAAEGSVSPMWKFMPSLGVGLGYQATKAVSLGLEYKVTWALSDGLDGQQWANNNTKSVTNDKYYYASAWLKFSFGRNTRTTPNNNVTSSNNNTITDPNTYTVATDKPVVKITNPAASIFTSASQAYTLIATITNVSSKNDIGLLYNGVSNTNFTYDAASHSFAFPIMLLNGNNSFMITATNANGSATDNATVLFELPVVVTPPAPAPIVTITGPAVNPYLTSMNNVTVVATVLNVTSASQIGVTVNGIATSSFIFNSTSHILNLNSNLIAGANTFVISATNASGSDSKSITIIYNLPVVISPPPVVTFVNPAINPYSTSVSTLPINALVQNVTSVGQISVTNNGAPVSTSMLSFNPSTAQLNFNVNLISGANTVVISATNIAGADSKSETIIYTQPVQELPPVVTITSPTVNPFNTSVSTAVVNATVLNVISASQIAVTINGVSTSAFTYNLSTKVLVIPVSLMSGANTITITATNSAGADSKSETIIYTQPVQELPPVVTITSPTVNPFNTSVSTAVVNATVLNVISASQIAVTVNGVSTSAFTYNLSTKVLVIPVSLMSGANTITITATNSAGADSKSETIIYSKPVQDLPPVVTITMPSTASSSTTSSVSVVEGTVLNVAGASNIRVKVNGVLISGFSYQIITKKIIFNASLVEGVNTIVVSAINSAGSDSKTITVNYVKHGDDTHNTENQTNGLGHTNEHNNHDSEGDDSEGEKKPLIVFTLANPYSTADAVVTVTAVVSNVVNQNNIVVKLNASIVPFKYNINTKTITIVGNVNIGANTISVTARNNQGTKTVTLVVNRQ